jgi:centrosomal protein CEP76
MTIISSQRPITTLLFPLQSRSIETPYHASRFVSLIPYEKETAPGKDKVEIWHTLHSFITRQSGDCEDHAILLCSLLLGFSIDAYVCVGSTTEGQHVWVMTRINKANKLQKVLFWESITGQRFELDDPMVMKFYKTIDAVFNHRSYYANMQPDNKVINTIFDLENSGKWKAMSTEILKSLTPWQVNIEFSSQDDALQKEEADFEEELREKLTTYRITSCLAPAIWDYNMSHVLSIALTNYEMEKVCGITFANDEFQSAINNLVPDGCTFKAYPTQIIGVDVNKALSVITSNQIGKDILSVKGDAIKFGLRSKIIKYPHGIKVVWVMLAVKFRSVF